MYRNVLISTCIIILFFFLVATAYAQQCTDNDLDGFFIEGVMCGFIDCDDSDDAVNPGAVEICDEIDNDCNADTGDGSGESWYGGSCDGPDADLCEEGMYECINGMQSCSDITRDTGEVCSDGIDNDCDGTIDEINSPELLIFSINPVADVSVNSGNSDRNYGTALTLKVEGLPVRIAYLRFDVTGLSGPVQSARLRLEVVDRSSLGGTIHSISDNSWDEDTVTFDTRPDVDGLALDTLGVVETGDVVEFDVTTAIKGNGMYNFAIVSDDTNTNKAAYRSREDLINPPVLIITSEEGSPFYCDDDFDGYMDMTGDGTFTVNGCIPEGCQTEPGNDCDDSDSAINPGAVETCYNDIDNDCDGMTDVNDTNCVGPCIDNDGDGYGSPGNINCPNGPVADCNDEDPAITAHNISFCDISTNNCDSIILSWTAPIHNIDGSDLNDLAGYKIYFGEYSNMYSDVIDIGKSTCNKVHTQSPAKSCFAITAYDTLGNESDYSNEACYVIN